MLHVAVFVRVSMCVCVCVGRVSSILDDLKGDPTEPVSFKTECCEPDTPQMPKLGSRTKTSLLLKWNVSAAAPVV